MISARHWRERRTFWPTLIFWAWLASFIFGFVATDALHSPQCPEQVALRALHDGGAAASQSSAAHALHLDASCPSCLLQLSALGISVLAAIFAVPLVSVFAFAGFRFDYAGARALDYQSRGPPVCFT